MYFIAFVDMFWYSKLSPIAAIEEPINSSGVDASWRSVLPPALVLAFGSGGGVPVDTDLPLYRVPEIGHVDFLAMALRGGRGRGGGGGGCGGGCSGGCCGRRGFRGCGRRGSVG